MRVPGIDRDRAVGDVEAESIMEVLPQPGQLHAGEGKLTGRSQRFERDGAGP